jgi:3-phenylpropionate/trans-cinnamate dioxygenase ferredoxin reductase subunit
MSGMVIIGAGQAAAEFVITLRAGGSDEPITMVGDEPYPPYQRPPLSKKFLAENGSPDWLYLRPSGFWREKNITLVLGTAARAITRARRTILLADGREIDYGRLVLATGARARIPALPGMQLAGVHSLRRIEDINALRPALDRARRVAIIGGGYIGLEVAAVIRSEGREVTLIEAEGRLMKRVTSPPVSTFYEKLHRGRGVDIRLGAKIDAIEGGERAERVRLADGATVAADLVLNATGARPNEEIAAVAGLPCEDGILVDERARTNDPDILAIGDCTRFPSRRFGRRVRLECVQNAFDQAEAAATALLGKAAAYDPVPWFWSDQYEVKFQSAGLADGHDRADLIGDPAAGHFSVEYRKDGRLIAVDAVNDGRAYMAGRRKIAAETSPA